MTRFTEAICIELTPVETDSLLLILNEARANLSLPVDHDVYREIMRKLGNIYGARCDENKDETAR